MNKISSESKSLGGLALIPFLVFIGVYLCTGIALQIAGVEKPFYQLPTPLAAFAGVIVAFLMYRGTFADKLKGFLDGCGNENIMTMCMIFLFAGAFTTVSKAMGGVDSVVNLGMTYIPPEFIAAGIFFMSAFISTATGTSVGTVTAVAPIALGLAQASGVSIPIIMGATLGGSMFGDNLSMISDTTIAATRTQGCEMRDKFKTNFYIALPAALITIVLLLIFGAPENVQAAQSYDFDIVKVLPYIFVLVAALCGVDVFIVLLGGIVFSGIIGIAGGSYDILGFCKDIFEGFTSMFEIFLLSMVTGGLAEMVQKAGGVAWLLEKLKGVVHSTKSAEGAIAVMTSLTNFATANNTVAILINAEIAKELSEQYNVEPRRAASLLDIFANCVQGIIPYGFQVLFVCSLMTDLSSPFEIIGNVWYCYILAICAVISIFVGYKVIGEKKKNKPSSAKETA